MTAQSRPKSFIRYWPYAVIVVLASLEPLTHLWIQSIRNDDAVATGLHTADSAIYLHSMRMFSTGFYSPYATCQAPHGPNDRGFFPTPFHWLYGIAGASGRLAGIDEFLFLGLANGLGLAAFLFCAYRFMQACLPRRADLAFLVYSLSGGLGGAAYLLSMAMGWHRHADFDTYFQRFSMYELVEGPYVSPLLYGARLYYSLSLAFCFAGMTAFIIAGRTGSRKHLAYSCLLLFCGTLVNLRFGGFALGVLALHQLFAVESGLRDRLRTVFVVCIPIAMGIGLSLGFIELSSAFAANISRLVREGMWLTPFLSACLFQLVLASSSGWRQLRNASALARFLLFGCAGYLAAFVILSVGYHVYYGAFLRGGDSSAALVVSDWALAGIPMGLALAWRPAREARPAADPMQLWLTIWFMLFAAVALSAFGQGWFIRLVPQRLMVFLGVPMALLAAEGIARLRENRPAVASGVVGVMVACGVASICVGTLFFRGPLGRSAGQGPFASLHREIMLPDDAALVARVPPGIVLAPDVFSDVLALRDGVRVLGGTGSTDLSDQVSMELQPLINAFFSGETTAEERRIFLDAWCVDYVYCPATWPVSAAEAFVAEPWVEGAAQTVGSATLFAVR